MAAEPLEREPNPDDPPAKAVDVAAAIDDLFGGFIADVPDEGTVLQSDDSPLPGLLDLLLLLRQAGATRTASPSPMPEAIGRYRVRRLAGRGGFSTVWEAFDPVLRRRVAVKVCSPDALVSPTLRRRFRREAELASRLVHPHIVAIHEVGDADGLDFITAEFCDGGSLAEWLAHHPGPVAPSVAARIARALAHAAAHAHAEGVVHRDIKPGNVMLVPVDGHDAAACIIPQAIAGPGGGATPAMTVKLADFGLGRQSEPGVGEDPLTQLTTDGSRLGTPAWMAPEQIDRSFGAVGPVTDVHAIGLLLDRMLTGRPLRGGKTDVETYREVLLDEPPAADRVHRGVPADLAAVCLRCLAKDPSERYQSAAALADDLGRWLAGQATRARPLSPLQRLGRTVARRPMVSALVAATILTTIVAGWAAAGRLRERSVAVAHRAEVRRQIAAAELRRGFESLRSGNVAAALTQIGRTRDLDPQLAGSLAVRWLERRLHGEREILVRPTSAAGDRKLRTDLHCLAISPDGTAVVAGGADGLIRLLRTNGRVAVIEIQAHDEVNDVCFSHDGRMVASVGQDGRLRWWTIEKPEAPAGDAPLAGCPLYAVAFSADDSTLWYGGEDRVVRRIAVGNQSPPQEVYRLPTAVGTTPEIEAMVHTGSAVVVACGGGLVALDAADGRLIWSWRHRDADKRRAVFHGLAASPDGRVVAAGGTDRDLGVWDATTGAHLATFLPHPNWIQGCAFSDDSTLLTTACRDGILRTFETSTQELKSKLVGHAGRVWDVAFEPGGTMISAGADGTLRRWNRPEDPSSTMLRELVTTGPAIRTVRDATCPGQACRIVTVRRGASPALIDIATGALTELAVGRHLPNDGAAADPGRDRVAFGLNGPESGRMPIVLSLNGQQVIQPPAPLPGTAIQIGPYLCWTRDGRLVANATDGGLYAWSSSLDRVTKLLADHPGIFRVEATPSGPPRLAVAGQPAVIIRCDEQGLPISPPLTLTSGDEMTSTIAWSPDGRWLACGFRDGAVHVFDGETGRRLGSLAPHERQIVDVMWSADGRTILTADADFVRISDSATFTAFDELRPGWMIDTMCLAGGDRFVVIGGQAVDAGSTQQARLALIDLAAP